MAKDTMSLCSYAQGFSAWLFREGSLAELFAKAVRHGFLERALWQSFFGRVLALEIRLEPTGYASTTCWLAERPSPVK